MTWKRHERNNNIRLFLNRRVKKKKLLYIQRVFEDFLYYASRRRENVSPYIPTSRDNSARVSQIPIAQNNNNNNII